MITHVVGARPNFMKAAPVVQALADLAVPQRLVHTGQHYDAAMSDIFFHQLGMPEPDINLGIGVAHVEAGLRSFDRTMPEEINRVLTDAIADLLLTTSPEAEQHLRAEGAIGRIEFVGNPMIDTLTRIVDSGRAVDPGRAGPYALVTLHRPANVDDPQRLGRIVEELREVSERIPVLFPVHPRGADALRAAGWQESERTATSPPVGYLEFVGLQRSAEVVITDSGGVQEETTMLGVPCVTVRPNTERPITITHGTNRLVEPDGIARSVRSVLAGTWQAPVDRPPLWDGQAAVRIAALLATTGAVSPG